MRCTGWYPLSAADDEFSPIAAQPYGHVRSELLRSNTRE
jgi:hypothetical protein